MKRPLAGRGTTIAVMGMLLALVAGGSYALAASGGNTITVCVKKHGGGLYKAKKCKKHDSKLIWNQQGPAGKAGKNGANGLSGAPGAAGAPGARGSDGIVQIGNWQDFVAEPPSSLDVDGTDFSFAGPTTTLTTTASQSISASGSAALGLSTGTATIELGICEQPAAGGTIAPLAGTGNYEIVDLSTTRLPYAISQAASPGAGSFKIGMCVRNNANAPLSIDNVDFSIGYAFVTNSSLPVASTSAALEKGLKTKHAH